MFSRLFPQSIGSVAAQALNALAGSIGVVFVLTSNQAVESFFAAVGYALLAQTVVALIVVIGLRLGNNSPLVRALGVIFAGITRGAMLWWLLWRANAEFPLDAGIAQLASSTVFTALWLLAAAHVVQAIRDYRSTFAARFDQAVTEGVRDSSQSTVWDEAQSLALSESALASERIDSITATPDQDLSRAMLKIASEIHAAALDRVRPASHRMWADSTQRPPNLPARIVTIRALFYWRAPVVIATTITGLVTAFGAIISRGLGIAIFTGLVVGAVSFILLSLRNRVQVSTNKSEALSGLLLLLIGPTTFLALEGVGRIINLPVDVSGSFVVSMASVVLCFVVIALAGIRQHQIKLLREMDRLLETGFWQTEVRRAIENRNAADAATFLHHRVQSQLLAVALQIELAAESDNVAAITASINKARSILGSPIDQPEKSLAGYDSLIQVPSEWEGICSVDLDLPSVMELPESTWHLVDMMTRELVANAVRSGDANQVEVILTPLSPETVEFTIHDNGIGGQLVEHRLTGKSLDSIGRAWVNTVTGDMRVTSSPNEGTRITLRVPVLR